MRKNAFAAPRGAYSAPPGTLAGFWVGGMVKGMETARGKVTEGKEGTEREKGGRMEFMGRESLCHWL